MHMTIHVVKPGETIRSIAENYGVSPFRLAADNGTSLDGTLAVGQTLVVQFPKQVHEVRSGDTLTGIAAQYGTSVRRLWQNNWPLRGSTVLTPGQELVLSYEGEKLGGIESNSYAYPFISPELLRAAIPYQTYLTPFTYGITAEGHLLELQDNELIAIAREHGTKPVMHLSTYTEDERFDTDRAKMVLTDEKIQTALIAEIQQMVIRKGFAGVDVDFEYLTADLADDYAAFLGNLRKTLGSDGYFVWAALAPKTYSGQPGLLYEGHDYSAIAAATDGVLLMTYEWGYTYKPCSYKY